MHISRETPSRARTPSASLFVVLAVGGCVWVITALKVERDGIDFGGRFK